jgi:lipopolysaccharide transport system permease protein
MIIGRLKEISGAPVEITKNLFHFRHILIQMVKREVKGRFAGSMGGLLWNFIHPVLMLLTYLFVFVYIFKLRIGSSEGAGASTIYLMAGLFPWIILAEGLSRGTSSLIENTNLIQKTSFPVEILTAKAVISPLLSHGIAILLLALYKIVFSGSFIIILALPVIIIFQMLFTLGMAFLTSAASVFFRDVLNLVQIIISFWIFLTPILYPIQMLPGWAQKVMYFNPLYPFVATYQSLFVEGVLSHTVILISVLIWSLGFLVFGAFIFNKLKYEFADWL